MRKVDWRQLFLPFNTAPKPPSCVEPTLPKATPAPPEPDGAVALEAHRKRIAGFLTMHMPDPVELTFTKNRSTMVSFRKIKGCYHVRLHHMFRHADTAMLNDLLGFLTTKKKASAAAIDRFIADHRDEIDQSRPRRNIATATAGKHFDLKEVLNRVANRYFGGVSDVRIGWGAAPRRPRRRRRRVAASRALATYNYADKLIRVSPVLDAPNVPDYVIDWIIYHELLHHVLPIERAGKKNIYHSAKFRSLERGFEHYEKAKTWEETHIAELLRLSF